MNNRFGWKQQHPDFRDFKFSPKINNLPGLIDLRPGMSPVVDQLAIGSCTANAIAAAVEYEQLKQEEWKSEKDRNVFSPSRLFIYYNSRDIEGTVDYDNGAQIRDVMKAISKQGVCPENEYPYDIEKFKDKPPQKCYDDGQKNLILQYWAIDQDKYSLMSSLAEGYGYPVIFGFSVYDSFDDIGTDGIMKIPEKTESMLGGHAVLAVGYDTTKNVFICRNSWGEDWGDKGYFYMPFEYISNPDLCSDFWRISSVESKVV